MRLDKGICLQAIAVLSLGTLSHLTCAASSSTAQPALENSSPQQNTIWGLGLGSPFAKFQTLNPKLAIQLGWFGASDGSSQHININGAIGDQFTPTNKGNSNSNGLFGVGVYVDGHQFNYASLSYGVNAFYLAPASIGGVVTQENLFENLSYGYSLTNWPIYFGAKANIKNSYTERANLTLDVGIGPNIMTSKFNEAQIEPSTIPDHIFAGTTTVTFTAMAGVGIRFNNAIGQVPLECGYRFFYLGDANFNTLTDQVTSKFQANNNYANAIVCGLTFG